MKRTRAMIVDDEPLARTRIRTLLSRNHSVEIVSECGDGREALREIAESKVDLVFLDIEMPLLNGIDVVASLPPDRRPAIIFVTAFNEHAVEAFELNAIDYLLKPFDANRFNVALERALGRLENEQDRDGDWQTRLASALDQLSKPTFADRLLVRDESNLKVVEVDQIHWIEADGKNAKLHTVNGEFSIRASLKNLEATLDPKRFVRIHRSTIVAVERIESLESLFHGDYCVLMSDGTRLSLSRNYRENLSKRFGNFL